eukprot:2668607-Ditylum_brightwellii.AAC.1
MALTLSTCFLQDIFFRGEVEPGCYFDWHCDDACIVICGWGGGEDLDVMDDVDAWVFGAFVVVVILILYVSSSAKEWGGTVVVVGDFDKICGPFAIIESVERFGIQIAVYIKQLVYV